LAKIKLDEKPVAREFYNRKLNINPPKGFGSIKPPI
jgi:hypothetical protein